MAHVRPWATVQSALAASAAGVPDQENAQRHDVSVKTIRRWRSDYVIGGRLRGQPHTSVLCPRCDNTGLDEAAYVELFGWYLGDGHLRSSRGGVFALDVYNDARYVEDNQRLLALMRRVKPGGRPHQCLKQGCVVSTVSWKHWPCLLPQHGAGRKHERPINLEDWQQELVTRNDGPFLRWLFHSDGARVANWARPRPDGPRYEYARWMFVNHSPDILDLCAEALARQDIDHRRPRPTCIAVSRRSAVAELDELIGLKR